MDELPLKKDEKIYILFENHIKKNGITYAHVGRMLNCTTTYIRNVCKGVEVLTEKTRVKMNGLFDTNF
jgi:plasmid maintenance system antidote protein VapI